MILKLSLTVLLLYYCCIVISFLYYLPLPLL